VYGKVFEDIFCSTLMDFGGDTAYVFIAMIVLSDENGVIKHTAESLGRLICKDIESVRRAIYHLEQPDLNSNLKSHSGRRIVPLYELSKDEVRGWLVVNKAHYRDQGSKVDRKDYMREYMRKVRNENKAVNSGKQPLAKLVHTDTDTDTKRHTPPYSGAFLRFWGSWPKNERKVSQGKCWAVWLKADFDLQAEAILAHVEALKKSADWKKGFVPLPITYLNQRRWEGAEPVEPKHEHGTPGRLAI
jgi:hypothetical protein